jgi:hypothetical protein
MKKISLLKTTAIIGTLFSFICSAAELGYKIYIEHLGDPDVLVLDDTWILTGSGNHVQLPFYIGNPETGFNFFMNYDPSVQDPSFRYCDVSAPDLSLFDNTYHLLFSAFRVPEGTQCPSDTSSQRTTYYVKTPVSDDPQFGVPSPLDFGPAAPSTSQAQHCSDPSACIRIDAAAFVDGGTKWLSYVYFNHGNKIASIEIGNPSQVILNVNPGPGDEGVTEGPEIIKMDGRYYLLYSAGHVQGRYHMRYVMADQPLNLTTELGTTHTLTQPAVRDSDGFILRSHGHGTIALFRGEYYIINHIVRGPHLGRSEYRHTVIAKLQFRPDGTIVSPTSMNISWNTSPEAQLYSLDIISKGRHYGPCIGTTFIGGSHSVNFDGVCRNDEAHVPLSEVDKFVVCSSTSNPWGSGIHCAEGKPSDALHGALQINFTH